MSFEINTNEEFKEFIATLKSSIDEAPSLQGRIKKNTLASFVAKAIPGKTSTFNINTLIADLNKKPEKTDTIKVVHPELKFNALLLSDMKNLASDIKGDIKEALLGEDSDYENPYDQIDEDCVISDGTMDLSIPNGEEEAEIFLSMTGSAIDERLNEQFGNISRNVKASMSFTSLHLKVAGFAYREIVRDEFARWLSFLAFDLNDAFYDFTERKDDEELSDSSATAGQIAAYRLLMLDHKNLDIEKALLEHMDAYTTELSVSFS